MYTRYVVKHNFFSPVFDDILCTHYILIYSTHNGEEAPQNILAFSPKVCAITVKEGFTGKDAM